MSKKILIIRMGAIGDVVHTSVIPYSIKQKHPEYEIHYLSRGASLSLLENCPYVDKIIKYDEKTFDTLKILYKERYDIIISLSRTLRDYIFSYLSFPKRAVFRGYKGDLWVENYFYTAKRVIKDIELPDRLYLSNDEKIEEKISDILNEYPKPHIVINPGRQSNNARQGRVWNLKKWKELSEKLIERYGGTVFVNGSKGEVSFHEELNNGKLVLFTGKFSLKESCALLSLADIVISVDSGPAHIAAAYGVNTISILGSTSPDKIKPYGKNGYYVEPTNKCRYCWKKKCKYLKEGEIYSPCIETVSVKSVLDKIETEKLL